MSPLVLCPLWFFHGFRADGLRITMLVARHRARLASRRWSGSPGQAFTRRAPIIGFKSTSCVLSSYSKLSWHNPPYVPDNNVLLHSGRIVLFACLINEGWHKCSLVVIYSLNVSLCTFCGVFQDDPCTTWRTKYNQRRPLSDATCASDCRLVGHPTTPR